ncbi:MAG: acyl-CoA thioesterase [Caulobacteraceae bacterium]|nr:acyl-CoA thioesterase [Caulobacter sp.]
MSDSPPAHAPFAAGRPPWPDEEPVIRTIAMPADTNPEGDIFGGWLLSQMDLAGATVAYGLARGRCATIAVDGMVFLNPVFVGDEVSLFARVLRVGRTSVRVAVEAWRRRRDSGDGHKVTEGAFTFVAIDEHRRPRPLPASAFASAESETAAT